MQQPIRERSVRTRYSKNRVGLPLRMTGVPVSFRAKIELDRSDSAATQRSQIVGSAADSPTWVE